jgi:hypothetical protein
VQFSVLNNLRGREPQQTTEIIFTNRRRHQCCQHPSTISGIARINTIKILGVTLTRCMSMAVHVQNVLNSCAHGLPTAALQNIYRSVVLAKVMYAASAWSGFASQTDRQRIDSFVQRGKRSGFCPFDTQDFAGLCQSADSKLFKSVLSNTNHLLHRLLPDKSEALLHYNLRSRPHDRQLPNCNSHLKLIRSNFLTVCFSIMFTDILSRFV